MEYSPDYVRLFVQLLEHFHSFFLQSQWWNCVKTMRLMVAMLPTNLHEKGNSVISALVEDLSTADSMAISQAKTTEQQSVTSEVLKGELIITARMKLQKLIETSGIHRVSFYMPYEVRA